MISSDRLKQMLNYDSHSGAFTRKVAPTKGKPIGSIAGYKTYYGYIEIMIDRRRYFAHRLAWLYMTGKWPKDQIDHINGVRDDNRFDNLREATNSENKRNSGKPKTNTSGLKGACFCKRSGKWMANIAAGGKRKHLGYFETAAEAHAAYRAAASRLHGEFARSD